MGDAPSFHKKTEEFIRKRQKEATPAKATAFFIIGTILTYIIFELVGFGNLSFVLRMGQTPDGMSMTLEAIRGIIQTALCILFPYIWLLWYI